MSQFRSGFQPPREAAATALIQIVDEKNKEKNILIQEVDGKKKEKKF